MHHEQGATHHGECLRRHFLNLGVRQLCTLAGHDNDAAEHTQTEDDLSGRHRALIIERDQGADHQRRTHQFVVGDLLALVEKPLPHLGKH